ncbi:hypothetical protein U1Q18_051091 [Sarracenia purpurea var. burkii]
MSMNTRRRAGINQRNSGAGGSNDPNENDGKVKVPKKLKQVRQVRYHLYLQDWMKPTEDLFDELVSDLELAGEKIDDYRCKMNFLQAIRMAYPDVVGKLEKNDLKNISLDCIKNNLRTHINDVQESSNRVENGSNEGDSNSIFYGASVDRGNSYRSRRGGNRYGHFRGKNGGVQNLIEGIIVTDVANLGM